MKLMLFVVLLSAQLRYFDPATDKMMMAEPVLRFLPDCPEPMEGLY